MPPQSTLPPLARRIRKLRKQRNMTLRDLAEAVGIKAPSVVEWENGEAAPRSHRLGAVAAALGVTVDELLGIKRAAS